jgi:hypothetical protein
MRVVVQGQIAVRDAAARNCQQQQFRNGIVPEWEWLLFWAWLCILWSLHVGVVLYWELLILRNAGSVTLLLMNGYLAKEFQFGT